MPPSARKSSIGGARRGIQKAHIPYRGDNPAVGKKTGIAVRHVERKSDGFEPFEEIMQQADMRSPPPLAGKRRKKKSFIVEVEDENGEMSMDLDNSPMPIYTSTRQQLATPTNTRVLSMSRIVAQSPDVPFDNVPSPRQPSLGRKSMGHTRPGPSRLSMASTIRYSSAESDAIDGVLQNRSEVNGFGQPPYSPDPGHASFTQMDQDDDDDDDDGNEPFREPDIPFVSDPPDMPPVEEESPSRNSGKLSTKSTKEKSREKEAERMDSGDEVGGYPDDMVEERQDEEEEPEPQPKKKGKGRATRDELNAAEQPQKRNRKENNPPRQGVRKSNRQPIKPLEWWRGERYVYGRDYDNRQPSEPVFVAPIKEIMRIPKEAPQPLGSKRKRSSRGRSKSRIVEQTPGLQNPEEGWDENTSNRCVVLDYPGETEKDRRIAFTAKMYQPQMAANSEWKYQRIFGDSEFIAAGQLTIPIAGRKPSKSTKDNTYIFYVAEGAVNFKVYDTSIILATGGMIMVPRGNTYYIENIAEREAKLVFTQARKIAPTEEEVQLQQQANNRRSLETGLQ
ncbi:Mif2/CENP-C like domain containing protein [Amanita muscaria]